jgi:lipopolysaccharide export system protein LptA
VTRLPPRPALSARVLRRVVLVVLLGVGVSVAWTYRRSPAARPGESPAPSPGATLPPARTENLVFKKLAGTREAFTLAAREMVGKEEEELHLRGVNFDFNYVSQGNPGQGNIVADECIYTPTLQKAVFQGHVVVRTDQGVELRTEQLIYRGDKSLARSEQPVEFSRKDLRGRSTGFVYQAEEGRLELPADVDVTVQDEGNPATNIKSARAVLERAEKTMRFTGGVTVVQGNDTLTADRFETDFTDDHTIYRARAIENVSLKTTGALPGTAAVSGGSGGRHLRSRKLDIWFRGNRLLQEATAGPDADLVLLPGAKDPPERRRLQARFLAFVYDEQGRLSELRGQKDSSFTSAPIAPAKGESRLLNCQSFVAKLDAPTGGVQYIEFTKDIAFSQGRKKATAQKAYYDGATAVLSLKEDPELHDAEQGSQLKAEAIDVGTRDGDLAARHQVRHVVQRKTGGGGLLSGRDQPLLLSARLFEYDAQAGLAVYREDALLRSGADEVRAPEIRLRDQEGVRRMDAVGGVVARLQPRREGQGSAPAPVEARAREMTYDQARAQMTYEGEVVIRQGEVILRGPSATMSLGADGRDLQKLVAGAPVEVQQGDRRVKGDRATYDLRAGTMAVVGDKVTLTDPGQEVQGRSLTFHLGDDRVVVDGQERVRTQTVIRSRKEPPTP